jgi:hypothetical protein
LNESGRFDKEDRLREMTNFREGDGFDDGGRFGEENRFREGNQLKKLATEDDQCGKIMQSEQN